MSDKLSEKLSKWLKINQNKSNDFEYYSVKEINNHSYCKNEVNLLKKFCKETFARVIKFRKSNTSLSLKYFSKYPQNLHPITKKGYFGELFIGFLLDYFSFFKMKWQPAIFGFYQHELAFMALEKSLVNEEPIKRCIGNSGEDVISFSMDSNNANIIGWLNCESKFRIKMDSNAINDALKKVSEKKISPVRIEQISDICSFEKRISLLNALNSIYPNGLNTIERIDLVFLIFSSKQNKNVKSCFDLEKPKFDYQGSNKFVAIETQISELNSLFMDIMEDDSIVN